MQLQWLVGHQGEDVVMGHGRHETGGSLRSMQMEYIEMLQWQMHLTAQQACVGVMSQEVQGVAQ